MQQIPEVSNCNNCRDFYDLKLSKMGLYHISTDKERDKNGSLIGYLQVTVISKMQQLFDYINEDAWQGVLIISMKMYNREY